MTDAPISQAALDLIVNCEVTGEGAYERLYTHLTWPGGASGATGGIGYDFGQVTKAESHADWAGLIPDATIAALDRCIGVKGASARELVAELKSTIVIPWDAAIEEFTRREIPKWLGRLDAALPNAGKPPPDSRGALLSVTYNRGAAGYTAPGDRYIEMRAIHAAMAACAFAEIPAQLRAMKRLWPDVPGLQTRREREAQLFEQGLGVRAADTVPPAPHPDPPTVHDALWARLAKIF